MTLTMFSLTLNGPHDAVALLIQFLCRSFFISLCRSFEPLPIYNYACVIFLELSHHLLSRWLWPPPVLWLILFDQKEVLLNNSFNYQDQQLLTNNHVFYFHLGWTCRIQVQVEDLPCALLQWVLVTEVEAVSAVLWNMRRRLQPAPCRGEMSPRRRRSTFPLRVERVRSKCTKSIQMESLWSSATPQTRYLWDWGIFWPKHSYSISSIKMW